MLQFLKRARDTAHENAMPIQGPAPPAGGTSEAQAIVGRLARQASQLGREAAEVRGVIDDNNRVAAAQAEAARQLAAHLDEITRVQQDIGDRTEAGVGAVSRAREAVESVGGEVAGIVDSLREVSDAASQITQIALQTRLVAFNASVEAKRAGEAGRGFGVVADAVRDLAARVEVSSKDITGTVSQLDGRIAALAREIQSRADNAAPPGAVHRALGEVEEGVTRIAAAAEQSRALAQTLNQRMAQIEGDMHRSMRSLDGAMKRSESFLELSEQLIEMVAESGLETEDTPYIAAAQQAAGEIAALLEGALRDGMVRIDDLFDEKYQPMAGTNPAQHTTRFCDVADRLFPAVQERVLGLSDKVVFCIAVDRNGYVACHNRKYNQPQRPGELAWNTANSRYRRIFNDRTGLASGRNQRPFLLQTYRRDMGGGQFIVMKEVAAPITVQGRHWGGLRLAFKF